MTPSVVYFQKFSVNPYPPEKMTKKSDGFDLRSAYE